MALAPVRLTGSFHEKVWGTTHLSPWFADAAVPIGEVWFTADDNRTATGETLRALMEQHGASLLGTSVMPGFNGCFPILTKFIFTSGKLSVQVHPEDQYAQRHENSPGKTEMWYLLRVQEGGSLALGFRESLTPERLRESALSGEIESLLQWWPVKEGETYFTPPRTVHAIGGGLGLVEIQQNSDITYRLYDYGRPRPLHLEKGVAVASLEPHPGPSQPVPVSENVQLLAHCPYFATELLVLPEEYEYTADPERFHLLVAIEGSGTLGEEPLEPGQVWLIPASAGSFFIRCTPKTRLLRSYAPSPTHP
jgi:mannose-6-phosphate isomerase